MNADFDWENMFTFDRVQCFHVRKKDTKIICLKYV